MMLLLRLLLQRQPLLLTMLLMATRLLLARVSVAIVVLIIVVAVVFVLVFARHKPRLGPVFVYSCSRRPRSHFRVCVYRRGRGRGRGLGLGRVPPLSSIYLYLSPWSSSSRVRRHAIIALLTRVRSRAL